MQNQQALTGAAVVDEPVQTKAAGEESLAPQQTPVMAAKWIMR